MHKQLEGFGEVGARKLQELRLLVHASAAGRTTRQCSMRIEGTHPELLLGRIGKLELFALLIEHLVGPNEVTHDIPCEVVAYETRS